MELSRLPVIDTVTLTNADTEYSITLPRGTKRFLFFTNHASGGFRLAFSQSKVAAPTEPYLTVNNGATYYEEGIDLYNNVTVYLASATAGLVVNCLYWT